MKMKHLFITLLIFISLSSYSQKKTYWTSGMEMIFSFAQIDDNGSTNGNIMRWAPVFNLQSMYNYDIGEHAGIFTGMAIRNVGYIYDNYTFYEGDELVTVKKKFRTYNFGIPIAIKVGNMAKGFAFAGYELELPFHYKEKTFRDNTKSKMTEWFSNRVVHVQHSFMFGYNFTRGTSIKFKYYITNFHNMGYPADDKPYAGLNANVWYLSLNFGLFRGAQFYYTEDTSKDYF